MNSRTMADIENDTPPLLSKMSTIMINEQLLGGVSIDNGHKPNIGDLKTDTRPDNTQTFVDMIDAQAYYRYCVMQLNMSDSSSDDC